MTWQYPWVVSGISEIGIDLARVMAYVASGGAEGVVGAGDLKITATGTPSDKVVVASGAFICNSRFSGVQYESYIGKNTAALEQVSVPTISSAKSHLVYANITDTGQLNQGTVVKTVETRVVECLNNVTALRQVPGYETATGLALARIDRTGSASTVTQGNIVDLRKLVSPRTETTNRFMVYDSSTSTFNTQLTSSSYVNYPGNASWSVSVPTWATRVQMIMNFNSLKIKGSNGNPIVVNAQLTLGSNLTSSTTVLDTAMGGGTPERVSIGLASEMALPPTGYAGTDQTLKIMMKKVSGSAQLWTDPGASVVVSLTFLEKAGD